MRQIVQFVTSNWGNAITIQWVSNVMLWVHIGLGAAILLGGPGRFTYPTYQPLVNLTQGHTWIWGVWILAAAVLMLLPLQWLNMLGLWLGMVWMIVWAAMSTVSVVNYSDSAATPMVVYAGFAGINAALLTALALEGGGG